jgi:hypothetical protein
MRVARAVAVVVAALVSAPGAGASGSPVFLGLTPLTVPRGGVVRIHGSAGDCPAGDAVAVLSRAFVATREFAGVPAVYARVGAGGAFATTTRIPVGRTPGRYAVTARCGGGNLGLKVALTVRR